ncbi:DUF6300 family protein [Kineosporia sp. NBRC 101731]|uniref:DUF6300 family protein n=1 Tax=Kineosporia sp. NBRC 101731 TaxID=3032199 RepID=UPI0024A2440A|nr:DUF6300 family protein [Kineosporia sp. NBRC 101731]GLY32445.1 hypothetical protein Kisp02_58100 [Kineosporia sp. NBRC 101731]
MTRPGPGPGGVPVTVETTAETVDCPDCSRPGIMSAVVPDTITGSGVAVLCETCDIDHPDAGPLITYFAVHGQINLENVDQGSALIARWLVTAQAKRSSPGGSHRGDGC